MKKLTVVLIAVFLFPASFALGGEHSALVKERSPLVNGDLTFAFHGDVPLQAQFMSDAEMVETQGEVLPLAVVILAHVFARVAANHVIRHKAAYIVNGVINGSILVIDYVTDQKAIDKAVKEHEKKSKAERDRIEREFAEKVNEIARQQAQEEEAAIAPYRHQYIFSSNNGPDTVLRPTFKPPQPPQPPTGFCVSGGASGMDVCTVTAHRPSPHGR